MKEGLICGGSCCSGKLIGRRKEVVVKMVVWTVQGEVLPNFGILMEMVILVLLMVRDWTWEMVVGVVEGVLWWVLGGIFIWEMEGLMRIIVAGTLGLSERSGKTSHTMSHSFSNSIPMRVVVGVDGVSLVK